MSADNETHSPKHEESLDKHSNLSDSEVTPNPTFSPARGQKAERMKPQGPATRRTVAVYEGEEVERLMEGLSVAGEPQNSTSSTQESTMDEPVTQELVVPPVSDSLLCSTCSATFEDRSEQREHYKSDWHRFNLKLKLRGLQTLTEDTFEKVAGDVSSISGSDSSDDEDLSGPEHEPRGSVLWNHTDSGAVQTPEEDEGTEVLESRRHPKVFFTNKQGELIAVHRCLLHGKKTYKEIPDLVSLGLSLAQHTLWCIIMLGGGHFAAAIFQGADVVEHKTFHRYVVRAKRGTAQSTRDQKGGNAPKSAGASLRRYNQAALTQDIQDVLHTWQASLTRCSHIFLRAPSYNKVTFFGGKMPILDKQDPRLRMIPFPTRRPTFSELKRVHGVLATIEVYGIETSLSDLIPRPSKRPAPTPQPSDTTAQCHSKVIEDGSVVQEDSESSTSGEEVDLMMDELSLDMTEALQPFTQSHRASPRSRKKRRGNRRIKGQDTESPDLDAGLQEVRNQLYTACKVGDLSLLEDGLVSLRQRISETPENSGTESVASLLSAGFGENRTTLLHVAARCGSGDIVEAILEAGADPVVRDREGQFAYVVASNKDTRQRFRKFRASYPDRYDYAKAQIPEPLSEEKEQERRAREAEKKRAQKKARKERLKGQKEAEMKAKKEEMEKQRYLALSDREKRALAAERRLMAQKQAEGEATPTLSRCWQCAEDITGKVPFEYYDYKFCSPKCLKLHKTQAKS